MEKDLHIEAGLKECGLNEEGEREYIGTEKQWKEYEKLVEIEEMGNYYDGHKE